jgi:hypothetical protein
VQPVAAVRSRPTKGALVASVAGQLTSTHTVVVVDGFELATGSSVLADFDTAREERRRLERARITQEQRIASDAANADALRARIADAAVAHDKALVEGKEGVDPTKLASEIATLQTRLDELEAGLAGHGRRSRVAAAAAAQFDAFATAVTAAPADRRYPPLVGAAVRERLHADRSGKVTHVLYVSVDSAGAETVRSARSSAAVYARWAGCTSRTSFSTLR